MVCLGSPSLCLAPRPAEPSTTRERPTVSGRERMCERGRGVFAHATLIRSCSLWCRFTKVFDQHSSQEEVFNEVARGVIDK